jgi:hypothetical protein
MMKSDEKSQDEQIRIEKGRAELEQRDQADQRNNGHNGDSKYNEVKKRDVMGNINPEGSYNEVNVRKEKVGDMHEKLNKSKSKRDKFEVTEEMKDVNKEYEAGVKAHQGRKPNMYEKYETR